MERIKSTFSIKNLENLSGIKAHTLRIWEKRYNLLEPERTQTNIRRYSLDSLRKLLNVTLLYNNGYKISKIASFSPIEIPEIVKNIALKSNSEQVSINAFKLSMINFDCELFNLNYNETLKHNDFEFVYIKIFMPLMRDLGILWQTGAISPSHEHFITNLVKQKIHIHTESQQKIKQKNDNHPIFVLFLPENEAHELGVLFLNYLILLNGYRTIFMGQSIQTSSLKTLYTYKTEFIFVSYLTVVPIKQGIMFFINEFYKEILEGKKSKLLLFGPQQKEIELNNLPTQIELYHSIEAFKVNFFYDSLYV